MSGLQWVKKRVRNGKIVKGLQCYTNDELWVVVDQRLTQRQDTPLCELIAQGKQGQLSADEQVEMERLVDLVDHQMSLRSEALLLLQQRGHQIDCFRFPQRFQRHAELELGAVCSLVFLPCFYPPQADFNLLFPSYACGLLFGGNYRK